MGSFCQGETLIICEALVVSILSAGVLLLGVGVILLLLKFYRALIR